jgi:hypothetical protein
VKLALDGDLIAYGSSAAGNKFAVYHCLNQTLNALA